jgi:tRNA-dihydrouridine synthase A
MVAPMLGWTTRHYRYLLRLITKKVKLYSEMISTGAILQSTHREKLLAYHPIEQPLAIQLGGSVPAELLQAAKIAEDYQYSEINLNLGCPSHKVQSGCFGAVLFKNADLVAECIAKIKTSVRLPITVKTRIAVDNYESYAYLSHFIQKVNAVGCEQFIIHARKAWLTGLNPKENRTIPPLNYAWVYQIKRDFPSLNIVINGGIHTLAEAYTHLNDVDGVMIGRAAWHNPYLFRVLDFQPQNSMQDRIALVQHYIPYAQAAFRHGENCAHLLQPLFGLFFGITGATHWRKQLTMAIQTRESPQAALSKLIREMTQFF